MPARTRAHLHAGSRLALRWLVLRMTSKTPGTPQPQPHEAQEIDTDTHVIHTADRSGLAVPLEAEEDIPSTDPGNQPLHKAR